MNNVVRPRAEMAVRLITVSSERGPKSEVRNSDLRDFSRNMENVPLLTASSRTDLIINQDRNDETRNSKNSEDGDFPAVNFNYDRKTQTHHNVFSTLIANLFHKIGITKFLNREKFKNV